MGTPASAGSAAAVSRAVASDVVVLVAAEVDADVNEFLGQIV
jgi:hypothetical protein